MNDWRNTLVIERVAPRRCVITAVVAVALSASTPIIPAPTRCTHPTAIVLRAQPPVTATRRTLSPAYKKSLRERYARMSQAQWFKDAYENRSVGEILPVA